MCTRDVFAAGTRTLVDRDHYFHLKAGHDNHLHHNEGNFHRVRVILFEADFNVYIIVLTLN